MIKKQQNNIVKKKISKDYKKSSEEWTVNSLGSLTSKIGSGITPKGGEAVYLKKGIPFIRSQNVGWGKFLLSEIAYISEEINKVMRATVLQKNDVLLNITGASIGRSVIVTKELEGGNVNQHVCIIRTTERLSPYFLNQYLLSSIGQNLINSFQAGGNRQGLNFEQIKSFEIPLPPLTEQQQIANILSTWDKAIETIEKLIAAKENLKKGLMQQLLTGKKRFKEFNELLEWKEVNSFGKVVTGNTPSRNNPSYWSGTFPWVSAIDLKTKYIFDTKEKLTEEGIKNARLLPKGSILVTCIASIGKNGIAGIDLATNQQINSIIPKSGYYSDYLYYVIEFYKKDLLSVAGITAVPIVNKSIFEQFSYLITTNTKEQHKIANILSTCDNEIEIFKKRHESLKKQKNGLMEKLLTGKIRVKF